MNKKTPQAVNIGEIWIDWLNPNDRFKVMKLTNRGLYLYLMEMTADRRNITRWSIGEFLNHHKKEQ